MGGLARIYVRRRAKLAADGGVPPEPPRLRRCHRVHAAGGPWTLVRFDDLGDAALRGESVEVQLSLRDGRSANLQLVWLSRVDRKALAAELEALGPGRVRGSSDTALAGTFV